MVPESREFLYLSIYLEYSTRCAFAILLVDTLSKFLAITNNILKARKTGRNNFFSVSAQMCVHMMSRGTS
jgi:hypothetical protein